MLVHGMLVHKECLYTRHPVFVFLEGVNLMAFSLHLNQCQVVIGMLVHHAIDGRAPSYFNIPGHSILRSAGEQDRFHQKEHSLLRDLPS